MALNFSIIVLLMSFGPSLQDSQGQELLNKAVDNFVDTTKHHLSNVTKLPEASTTEKILVPPFNAPGYLLEANFSLQGGHIYGLTHLSRVGDVAVTNTSSSSSKENVVTLEFYNIIVLYENFNVNFRDCPFYGDCLFRDKNGLAFTSKENVTVDVHFIFGKTKCAIDVKNVVFTKPLAFEVHFEYDKPEHVSDDDYSTIKSMIEDKVREILTAQIKSSSRKYNEDCEGKELESY